MRSLQWIITVATVITSTSQLHAYQSGGMSLNQLLFVTPSVHMASDASADPVNVAGTITPVFQPAMSVTNHNPMEGNIFFQGQAVLPLANLNSAYQATANGCGADSSIFNSNVIPQQIGGASFANACDHHDICYGTLWSSKSVCDDQFRAEMLQACGTIPSSWAQFKCASGANLYFNAVSIGGGEAFLQAQNQALFSGASVPSLMAPQPSFTDKFSLIPRSSENNYHLIDWSDFPRFSEFQLGSSLLP